MGRPVALVTAQWTDLSLDEACALAARMDYDGIEMACWGHVDVSRAATDVAYASEIRGTLARHGLQCHALAAHLAGQCVGDVWDPRLDGFAPADLAGRPEAIRDWAIEEMKRTAHAAKALGVKVVTGFMGSAIWKYWYSFPQTTEEMVEAGYAQCLERWSPIFDVFDECGVRFALEVHPTEIAFDYYSTRKLFEVFGGRSTLGINFDPSHLIWQGVDPVTFIRDFSDRIYNVHMKDAAVTLNGRNGILGSHLPFGDTRRGWNFVSLGHGSVDFDKIIRELNAIRYAGPLAVEWEDSGMERIFGASEACAFVRKINFSPSTRAFDGAMRDK